MQSNFNIFIKLERVQIPILFYYYIFADYSNYINEKKNEINKKQERARELINEFAENTEASCQGREKDILQVLGQLVGTTGFLLAVNFPPLETIKMIKNNIFSVISYANTNNIKIEMLIRNNSCCIKI